MPPSTTNAAPVTKEDSSEARKSAALADGDPYGEAMQLAATHDEHR
jgi:hypothetical protein